MVNFWKDGVLSTVYPYIKKKEVLDVCEGVAKKNGKSAEVETTEDIILTLESFGQMPVGDIFVNCIGVLKKDLDNFSKTIGKA